MDQTLIENLIAKHEGRRAKVYPDSRGIPTIGIGWNLTDKDSQDICDHFGLSLPGLLDGSILLTDAQIDEVFDYQLHEAISEAMSILPNFNTMPDTVQAVVVDLLFNMGLPRFSQFYNTILSLKNGNWEAAAENLRHSLWYTQVGHRAVEDCAMLEAA